MGSKSNSLIKAYVFLRSSADIHAHQRRHLAHSTVRPATQSTMDWPADEFKSSVGWLAIWVLRVNPATSETEIFGTVEAVCENDARGNEDYGQRQKPCHPRDECHSGLDCTASGP
ncbi:hypothetical protein D9611_009959 [Ephemerocybe angulata]|uniref:Uncharacterized protein n=1 Tax=Ephemerocybe angulata TaxID=980116 RepID=A0A8H5C444_9AGAR|nr:hypothetical protein D9611_009959 [Tulosesus angulatus]